MMKYILEQQVFRMIREKQKSYKSRVKGFAVSILIFEFLLHHRFRFVDENVLN